MFAGINAHISEEGIFSPYFTEYGQELYNNQKNTVKRQIDSYVLDDGILGASHIEEDWFPNIKSDVFISHSHRDQELAIGLAGWLHNIFGITSFIDSCVWGYADDLLKIIDTEYCVKKKRQDGSIETYDYDKRNQSTAHVHMILNTALQKMIDKTECLIFLNTPNSLLVDDVIDGTATASPWIYSELTFSRMCRKKKLAEYRKDLMHTAILEHREIKIRYDVSLEHFVELKDSDLLNIWINSNGKEPLEVLDDLYVNLKLISGGV